jgi:hypothetical protein
LLKFKAVFASRSADPVIVELRRIFWQLQTLQGPVNTVAWTNTFKAAPLLKQFANLDEDSHEFMLKLLEHIQNEDKKLFAVAQGIIGVNIEGIGPCLDVALPVKHGINPDTECNRRIIRIMFSKSCESFACAVVGQLRKHRPADGALVFEGLPKVLNVLLMRYRPGQFTNAGRLMKANDR